MVADLGKSPEIAGCKRGVPKSLTLLASAFPLILTLDKLCDNSDRLSVVVIKLKEPVKVLNSNARHSELCVVNRSARGFLQPVSKLVRIRNISVCFYTGVKLVSGKTVSISHRVTE